MYDRRIKELTTPTIGRGICLVVVLEMPLEVLNYLPACRAPGSSLIAPGSEPEVKQQPVLEAGYRNGQIYSRSSLAAGPLQPAPKAVDFGNAFIMIENTPYLVLSRVLCHLSFYSFHHVGKCSGPLNPHTAQSEICLERLEVIWLRGDSFAENQNP